MNNRNHKYLVTEEQNKLNKIIVPESESRSAPYLKLGIFCSVVWLIILLVYFIRSPELFLRMFPNEVGDLFAGWFAPVAFLWVAIAVFLQRAQLNAQKKELIENTEALRIQAQDMRESVIQLKRVAEQMEKEAEQRETERIHGLIDRLCERLAFGIERVARISEPFALKSPKKTSQAAVERAFFGKEREYVDATRTGDYVRVLQGFKIRLESCVKKLKTDWVLEVELETIEALAVEMQFIERVSRELERLICKLKDNSTLPEFPSSSEISDFVKSVQLTFTEFDALQQDHQALNGTS